MPSHQLRRVRILLEPSSQHSRKSVWKTLSWGAPVAAYIRGDAAYSPYRSSNAGSEVQMQHLPHVAVDAFESSRPVVPPRPPPTSKKAPPVRPRPPPPSNTALVVTIQRAVALPLDMRFGTGALLTVPGVGFGGLLSPSRACVIHPRRRHREGVVGASVSRRCQDGKGGVRSDNAVIVGGGCKLKLCVAGWQARSIPSRSCGCPWG